jgi:hypothetical protein
MVAWFRRRAESPALIEADANALIERFGEQAYSEVRLRQHAIPELIENVERGCGTESLEFLLNLA